MLRAKCLLPLILRRTCCHLLMNSQMLCECCCWEHCQNLFRESDILIYSRSTVIKRLLVAAPMALIWKTIHWCRRLHHLAMPRNLSPGCRSGLNTFRLDAYQMCRQSSTFPPNEHLLTLATLPHSVKETLISFLLALDVGVLRDVVAVGPLIPTVWQSSMGNWGTYWASWSLLSFLAFSIFTSHHPPSVHTHINMDGCVFLCIFVFVCLVCVARPLLCKEGDSLL